MAGLRILLLAGGLVLAAGGATAAQTIAVDQAVAVDGDDILISGCLMRPGALVAGTPSLLVWSPGNLFLESVVVQMPAGVPIGTTGTNQMVFYWLDDERELAGFAGQRIEVVGELDELEEAEFELDHEGAFTEIQFQRNGRDVKTSVPSAWLGPGIRGHDREIDVVVRTVDVERITALGTCDR